MTRKKLYVSAPENGPTKKREATLCHARWFADGYIHSCRAVARLKSLRCVDHAPDGSRIDENGRPEKHRVQRRTVR